MGVALVEWNELRRECISKSNCDYCVLIAHGICWCLICSHLAISNLNLNRSFSLEILYLKEINANCSVSNFAAWMTRPG